MGKLSALVCLCLLLGNLPSRAALTTAAQAQTKQETLTNAAVIELVKLGFSDTIIIEKVRQSDCRFDLSLEGMKQLKAARVSEAVIQTMLNPHPAAPQHSSPTSLSTGPGGAPTALRDSDGKPIPLPPDKGAYLWDGKKLSLLVQSPVPSVGANFGRQMLGMAVPFVKQKYELQMVGARAKFSIDHNQPVIIVSGLGEVIPGMPSYRLLYVKTGGMLKDRRIVGNYEIGGFFGSINRVENEISCEIKKVSEGIYAIIPSKSLSDGEYGLVQVPKMGEMKMDAKSVAAPPVWDFGVYVEGRPGK